MKKLSKKTIILSLIITILMSGTTIYAATVGSFSFEMHTAVYGSREYSLSNKDTSVSATANTYNYASGNTTTSQSYKVALPKSTLISVYSWKSIGKADGTKRTVSFGKMDAGKYKVNTAVSNTQGTKVWYIKGTGTINQ